MDMMLGFLGTYITAAEIGAKTPTLTIARVTLEKVESLKTDDDGAGKTKDRVIVYFRESKSDRGWLLNRTNAECLRELWGRETDQWVGHRVTLMTLPVRVGPKMEPGIRVKGSPDIDKPHTFSLKLPRKKPIPTTLVPTGWKPHQEQAPKQTPPNDQPLEGFAFLPNELLSRIGTAKDMDELAECGDLIGSLPDQAWRDKAGAAYKARMAELDGG